MASPFVYKGNNVRASFWFVFGIFATLLLVGCDESEKSSPFVDSPFVDAPSPQGESHLVDNPVQDSPRRQVTVPSTQPTTTPTQGNLGAAAMTFRIAAARGMDQALVPVLSSSGSVADWHAKFNETRYKHLWPFFFSGSLIKSGYQQGSTPVIAFYNPYVDAAVFTQWSESEISPKITNICILLGVDVIGGGDRSNPRWSTGNDCLAANLLDGWTSFSSAFPHSSVEFSSNDLVASSQASQNFKIVEQRCLAITRELAHLGRGSAAADSGNALRLLLDDCKDPTGRRLEARLPANNPVPADAITSLGSSLLNRLRPTLFINAPEGAVIVLIDSSEPSTMLTTHFSKTNPEGLLSILPFSFN